MEAARQIDTNLQGQRLGRKGRFTRERILAAARALIEDPEGEPASLSAVARRADLRLSSIYNYFADLTELFMAVLEPIAEESEDAYLRLIREYWPDEELAERCMQFVLAFHDYWRRHARVLHLRNAMAEQQDQRLVIQRIEMARLAIGLLAQQMGGSPAQNVGMPNDLASVLFTGLERVVTIATSEGTRGSYPGKVGYRFEANTLKQQARVLALAIADERARAASTPTRGLGN